MSNKRNAKRAKAAARGTAADPGRAAREMRREAQRQTEDSRKLVGVMPEGMADEVKKTGVYPFTFKSAFAIAAAALLGTIVIPFLVSGSGVSVALSTTVTLPVLMAAALAVTRYFVDSDRGLCRGFIITLVVAYIAVLLICWLLFYQGILL